MGLPYATTAQLDKIEKAVNEKQDKLEVTSADAGKIVAVNEQGELSLVDAPSGGTKLYKHEIILKRSSGSPLTYHIITTDSIAYSQLSEIVNANILRYDENAFFYTGPDLLTFENKSVIVNGNTYYLYDIMVQNNTIHSSSNEIDSIKTDTVTEL